LLKAQKVQYSNFLLKEICDSVDSSIPFTNSTRKISKNNGITLLSSDSSEERLQLFHYPTVIGGSWQAKDEQLVAIQSKKYRQKRSLGINLHLLAIILTLF
jgi:hypothetical protein